MAVYAIGATSLIGGAAGALDAEYVNAFGAQPGIGNGDIAFTFYDNKVYHHVANATSGASESSPDVIAPDEESPGVAYTGNLRWILCGIYNAVKISGTPVDNDFAKFTDALTIEGRSYAEVRSDLNVEDGSEANNISDVNATDLTDGGDTTLHDHDGISENTSARHTQGTDVALGAVSAKNPPIDADKAIYRDSTDADAVVTSTWTQVKTFLKTYFDTLYNKYVHPNHSGEVTSVADGTQTIAADAVTYAKMQNVVSDERILGRVSGADGVVEELTKTEVLTMINVANGADVTGDNAPKVHKDSHDPEDGGDALDCASPSELAGVQAAGEGSSHSFARSDHSHQVQHSIVDNHLITVDQADAASGEYARMTANGIESRSKSEAQADLGFYSGAGTFNGTTGDEISIGATLGGTSYQGSILPTGDSLNVGAIYIDTKTTTTFLVKCTGSGTPTFDWKLIDKN